MKTFILFVVGMIVGAFVSHTFAQVSFVDSKFPVVASSTVLYIPVDFKDSAVQLNVVNAKMKRNDINEYLHEISQ